jgi:hypothetical protein
MNQKVGRKPTPIINEKILYQDKIYYIGCIKSIKGMIKFIIDNEDYDKIYQKSWHVTTAGYISCYYPTDNGIKQLLLHRFIMNLLDFPGKGATVSVDHINRNPLDNRKENLRIISQTYQNLNQSKKKRRVELPENCGINPDDIPKHIWYIKANGDHGDRFAIEFKTENILWKTTSSKRLPLIEKLNQAKYQLAEFYNQYPYLDPNNLEKLSQENKLNDSSEKIIKLSSNP